MIAFKAVCYLVYTRRHLKNTRTVFQKEVKTWSDEFVLTRNWPKSWPCSWELLQTCVCVRQEIAHKADLLCKVDVNRNNPILSFFFRFISQRMHVHTWMHIFTRTRIISELTRNSPYGFKSLPWTSGCFASLQQMKGERDVVLHFIAQNISRESRGTFCDSLILLHECENGVRRNWLMYFLQKPIL